MGRIVDLTENKNKGKKKATKKEEEEKKRLSVSAGRNWKACDWRWPFVSEGSKKVGR